MVIVISLIVAIMGLTLFWLFISHNVESVDEFIQLIKCNICKSIPEFMRGSIDCEC